MSRRSINRRTYCTACHEACRPPFIRIPGRRFLTDVCPPHDHPTHSECIYLSFCCGVVRPPWRVVMPMTSATCLTVIPGRTVPRHEVKKRLYILNIHETLAERGLLIFSPRGTFGDRCCLAGACTYYVGGNVRKSSYRATWTRVRFQYAAVCSRK